MSEMVTQKVIEQCRQIDLYEYLVETEPHNWIICNKYLKHKEHDSLVITKGKGWIWNSRNLNGGTNPIDFLCEFYNLSFKKAVNIIQNHVPIQFNMYQKDIPHNIPPIKISSKNQLIYDYLCRQRFLSIDVIKDLIEQGKIYLTQNRNFYNICFYDSQSNHCQITGTLKTRYKYCSDGNGYWWFGSHQKNKAYICESPIDAISLFEILQDPNVTYISIGGCCSRKKVIDKIVSAFAEVFLAIDNDTAGNELAIYYKHLKRIIPIRKDWNEDLKYRHQSSSLLK